MKDVDISIIDPDDRVLDIGEYNASVMFCPFCYPEYIDFGGRTTIGFGTDIYGNTVQVHECPVCFQKSHHHIGDIHSYEIYKNFKSLGLLKSQQLTNPKTKEPKQ
jgi:hypothetical protein